MLYYSNIIIYIYNIIICYTVIKKTGISLQMYRKAYIQSKLNREMKYASSFCLSMITSGLFEINPLFVEYFWSGGLGVFIWPVWFPAVFTGKKFKS